MQICADSCCTRILNPNADPWPFELASTQMTTILCQVSSHSNQGFSFYHANLPTHIHTHIHRDKVIAISAPQHCVISADKKTIISAVNRKIRTKRSIKSPNCYRFKFIRHIVKRTFFIAERNGKTILSVSVADGSTSAVAIDCSCCWSRWHLATCCSSLRNIIISCTSSPAGLTSRRLNHVELLRLVTRINSLPPRKLVRTQRTWLVKKLWTDSDEILYLKLWMRVTFRIYDPITPSQVTVCDALHQWCGLRSSVFEQDRSQTYQKIGLGLAGLVLCCETRSCYNRRHNDL